MADRLFAGLYTDESPGLKVDPVIVLVLSLVFIFSVVALHGMYSVFFPYLGDTACCLRQATNTIYQ